MGPRLTYIPRSTQSILGQTREGGGGVPPPRPTPLRAPWDHVTLPLIGSLPLPRDPLFLYKNPTTPPSSLEASKQASKQVNGITVSPFLFLLSSFYMVFMSVDFFWRIEE